MTSLLVDMPGMVEVNGHVKSSRDSATLLSIGEVAQRFGLPTHVLRYWESMGLMAPTRGVGARRGYGPDDLFRLVVVLRAKRAGFGLEAIRRIVTAQEPATRTDLLRRHRAQLLDRIAAAQASLDLIDAALHCEHEDIAQCPHFRAMVAEETQGLLRG
ncbi:MerR family transcriptional regulator [Geodermatophilus aquaeductus]|uniref:MerR family transcriptional regulator n=1 Tax=Geodermatophilus aquaeductus TaxID=1564161 RepID=UPI001C8DE7E9|nr:MerR family transcriptional regulator [Geodermatophilus aquaeductus]